MRKLALAAVLVVAGISLAWGQNSVDADSSNTQLAVGRDESGFSSCGVRAVVGTLVGDRVQFYDLSLSTMRGIVGVLMKAGSYVYPVKDLGKYATATPPAKSPAPVKFWIVKATESQPAVSTTSLHSETKNFLLSSGEFEPGLRAMLALAYGERMQFAVKYPDDKLDHVVAFASPLSPADQETFHACVSGLLEQLQEKVVH